MRVIFCGSRDWTDYATIEHHMSDMAMSADGLVVVHGGARGADVLAGAAARTLGLFEEEHPADWVGRGRAAGHERNRLMLDLGADHVIAFKDNFDHTLRRGGTENMIRIAREAGISTFVVERPW
jgi:hypothetical protein